MSFLNVLHVIDFFHFQAFYFPEHAGLPFFENSDDGPLLMRLEMHYDNPSHTEGKINLLAGKSTCLMKI